MLSIYKFYIPYKKQEILDCPVKKKQRAAGYKVHGAHMQSLYSAAAYEAHGLTGVENNAEDDSVGDKRMVYKTLKYISPKKKQKRSCASAAGAVYSRQRAENAEVRDKSRAACYVPA